MSHPERDKPNDVSGWNIFIDLLGVRYMSEHTPDDLLEDFNIFFEIIEDISNQYDCRVFCFSDSALIVMEKLSEVVDFIGTIRPSLYGRNIFFKAGIHFGQTALRWPEDQSKMVGVSLAGRGVTTAYGAQSNLNSVGAHVAPSSKPSIQKEIAESQGRGELFQSIAIRSSSNRSKELLCSRFLDVGLSLSEIGQRFDLDGSVELEEIDGFSAIDVALQNFWSMRDLHYETALKFSLFISGISISSDFDEMVFDTEEKSWMNCTPIAYRLFLHPKHRSLFSDQSFDFAYLISLSKIIQARYNAIFSDKRSGDPNPNRKERLDLLSGDVTVMKVCSIAFRRANIIRNLSRLTLIPGQTRDDMRKLYGAMRGLP